MNFSTVPPKRSMSALTRSWYGPERGADVLGVGAVGAIREADEIDEEDGDDLALLTPGRGLDQRGAAGETEARALGVLLATRGTDLHAPDLRSDGKERLRGGRKLGRLVLVRRLLVFCEAPLQHAPREDADQPLSLVDDGNPLGVLGLEKPERVLERHVRADGVVAEVPRFSRVAWSAGRGRPRPPRARVSCA